VDQAAGESDTVVLAGFSLGSVLTLTEALRPNSSVDALIALSPAYYLSTYRLARWTPFLHPLKKWIDSGPADDAMRYEAMPTRGVAETVKAMQQAHRDIKRADGVAIPWLLVQSVDDAVTVPQQNAAFFHLHARHENSRLVQFYSAQAPNENDGAVWISGSDQRLRVDALTHLAIHSSPENSHYGVRGAYRNCGGTGPRDRDQVAACLEADEVWYGLWRVAPPNGRAQAMSTFNPAFDRLAEQITGFLKGV